LKIKWGSGKPGVTSQQQIGTEKVQPVNRPAQQRPNDRLGGPVPPRTRQFIQVTLDRDRGGIISHRD
jgi:hypothetical protein